VESREDACVLNVLTTGTVSKQCGTARQYLSPAAASVLSHYNLQPFLLVTETTFDSIDHGNGVAGHPQDGCREEQSSIARQSCVAAQAAPAAKVEGTPTESSRSQSVLGHDVECARYAAPLDSLKWPKNEMIEMRMEVVARYNMCH